MSDTMDDLPSRHEAKRFVFSTFTDGNDALVPAIVRAYAIGDLMTREEFIDSLDLEAATDAIPQWIQDALSPGLAHDALIDILFAAALGNTE